MESLKLLYEVPCLSWRHQYLGLCKQLHSGLGRFLLEWDLCALLLVPCCQCSWEHRGCSSRRALLKWSYSTLTAFAKCLQTCIFFFHCLKGFLPSMHCLYHLFCLSLFKSCLSHQRSQILVTIPFAPPQMFPYLYLLLHILILHCTLPFCLSSLYVLTLFNE